MKVIRQIIGFDDTASGTDTFSSYNPAALNNNGYLFYRATSEEIDLAAEKATAAFQLYRKKSGTEKAVFLEAIADAILKTGDELVEICTSETALPAMRIQGERVRTVNQLKMFAELLREGSWVDARIETALPGRAPLPKPDLRYMQMPLGPVVVFGASNFPLAFSVAGGDTASALAAGCPVIVKAHPAHPATSAIIGKAIQEAAQKTNMPDGVFSLLFDDGITVGTTLVKHPAVKAVGFTGSYKAGKALFDIAVNRPEPIPVYAEMGSTNPVFVLPGAMKENGETIASGYAASVTLGVGQFCTNPGLLFYQNTTGDFKTQLKNQFEKTNGGTMLATNIAAAFHSGMQHQASVNGVEELAKGQDVTGTAGNSAQPVLLATAANVLQKNPSLSEEIFGPASIAVNVHSKEEMLEMAANLSGHLTATVFGNDEELPQYKELLDILEQKAGRVIINGFPTGVEVCSAMVHGGPFPATTNSRSTSVGTAAIFRFARPVCYQNVPQALLPAALQNKNSLGIYRLVNGSSTNNDII
jgi:2,5-dioxopentanoate dehydrogenase